MNPACLSLPADLQSIQTLSWWAQPQSSRWPPVPWYFPPQRAYTQLWKGRKLSQWEQPGDFCSHLAVVELGWGRPRWRQCKQKERVEGARPEASIAGQMWPGMGGMGVRPYLLGRVKLLPWPKQPGPCIFLQMHLSLSPTPPLLHHTSVLFCSGAYQALLLPRVHPPPNPTDSSLGPEGPPHTITSPRLG